MDLHTRPPMTLRQLTARQRWILPTALGLFLLLAVGAVVGALPWDQPITGWLVSLRTPEANGWVRYVSRLGSTPVVISVAAIAALFAVRRCPRLALGIVVIALCRPLIEFALKELISRDRPAGDRLVDGTGYSFPSGHPLATAASWGLLPPVVALYTRRRAIWWASVVAVWVLALGVAFSRVWLGVHWTSDVIAALALTVLGVAGAEWLLMRLHRAGSGDGGRCGLEPADGSGAADAEDVDPEVVDRPVFEAAP